MKKYRSLFFIISFAVLMNSCAGFSGYREKPPEITPETKYFLSILENMNKRIKSFKGLGKIFLEKDTIRQNERAAWIGVLPEKLRIDVLSITGRPVLSLAADGKYLYAVSHKQNKFYKTEETDPNLKNMIGIPITAGFVIELLAGRIPVKEYFYAETFSDEKTGGYVLVFKNRWGRALEKIYFNKDKNRVEKFELFKRGYDKPVCYGKIKDIKLKDQYKIPFEITLFNDNARFKIKTDKYWTDPPVKPSSFILKDPEI